MVASSTESSKHTAPSLHLPTLLSSSFSVFLSFFEQNSDNSFLLDIRSVLVTTFLKVTICFGFYWKSKTLL